MIAAACCSRLRTTSPTVVSLCILLEVPGAAMAQQKIKRTAADLKLRLHELGFDLFAEQLDREAERHVRCGRTEDAREAGERLPGELRRIVVTVVTEQAWRDRRQELRMV